MGGDLIDGIVLARGIRLGFARHSSLAVKYRPVYSSHLNHGGFVKEKDISEALRINSSLRLTHSRF